MAPTSTPKPSRPIPFTPKRPLSAASQHRDLPRSSTPASAAMSSIKKFKATLTSESRTHRLLSKSKPLNSVPGSPARSSSGLDVTRPRTPGTPRSRSPLPGGPAMTSEMDVSRVDPEEVLVDAQNVEPGDVSADIDETWLNGADHGKEDKVLVSIRYGLATV